MRPLLTVCGTIVLVWTILTTWSRGSSLAKNNQLLANVRWLDRAFRFPALRTRDHIGIPLFFDRPPRLLLLDLAHALCVDLLAPRH